MNERLREQGYVQLPPLWVLPEDLIAIKKHAERYQSHVNNVRAAVRNAKKWEKQKERWKNEPSNQSRD